jgi:hypothetical protein
MDPRQAPRDYYLTRKDVNKWAKITEDDSVGNDTQAEVSLLEPHYVLSYFLI